MSEHIIKLSRWSATDYSWCYNNTEGVWWTEELEFHFDEKDDADDFANYLKMENIEYEQRRILVVPKISSEESFGDNLAREA